MSRIGKKPILIPKDVLVTLEKSKIVIKGKHGILERSYINGINISIDDNKIIITRTCDTKELRSCHGLMRALIYNMIYGVTNQFSKILVAEGVGYKFQLNQNTLVLSMGYSHPVEFPIPSDLGIKVESPTKIAVIGIEKERVGFLAAKIREIRPPEPYKGKGIRYENEIILRKAGKTGKK